jgi:predicted flap endonuclease-1-like 5' DNA nuclease
MAYPITAIGIDADEAKQLKALRIRTTERLLEAAKTPKGRKELAAQTGIDEKRLLCLANTADRMRVKGLGKEYAAILPEVGVATVKELKYRNPENLAKAIGDLNKKRKLVRFLPTVGLVTRWVEHAKKLPMKISYR